MASPEVLHSEVAVDLAPSLVPQLHSDLLVLSSSYSAPQVEGIADWLILSIAAFIVRLSLGRRAVLTEVCSLAIVLALVKLF